VWPRGCVCISKRQQDTELLVHRYSKVIITTRSLCLIWYLLRIVKQLSFGWLIGSNHSDVSCQLLSQEISDGRFSLSVSSNDVVWNNLRQQSNKMGKSGSKMKKRRSQSK
jgi:hypothetical protein